jgi:hypothetical protein
MLVVEKNVRASLVYECVHGVCEHYANGRHALLFAIGRLPKTVAPYTNDAIEKGLARSAL